MKNKYPQSRALWYCRFHIEGCAIAGEQIPHTPRMNRPKGRGIKLQQASPNKNVYLVILVSLLAFRLISCSMAEKDFVFEMEYYKINESIFNNRPTDVTNSEKLAYVKNASGTGKKNTYWTNSFDSLNKRVSEISGIDSLPSNFVSLIQSHYIATFWTYPEWYSTNKDYWFFYVENNDNNLYTCSFDTNWSYNETQHWKECKLKCGKKSEVSNHHYGGGVTEGGGTCFCGYITNINGLPPANILAQWGLTGFTLPVGVTVKQWYQYSPSPYGGFILDINAETDISNQIATRLIANGWVLPAGSTQYKKDNYRLALNYFSGSWVVTLQIMNF